MGINWKRLLAAFVVAELIPIAVLVAIIAMARPADVDPTAFADRVGTWVGPIAGAIMAFLMARWLVRPITPSPPSLARASAASFGVAGRARHGLALGVLLAVLDAVLLIAASQPFHWVPVVSNAGKIVAAVAGAVTARPR